VITRASAGATALGTAVTLGGDRYFGWGDLIKLWDSLAAPYRAVGTWMVSTDAHTKIL
jgi:hypothetical protein